MFEKLSERFNRLVKNLSGQGRISEKNAEEALREVRLALLEADVHYQVVKEFLEKVKEKALGERVWDALSPGQQFIKIVRDEMTSLLGGNRRELFLSSQPPTVILMAGLQGTGKTTTAGKLALHFKQKRGKNALLVSMDLQRPAAQEQLKTLAEQVGVPFLAAPAKTPVEIARVARDEAMRRAAEILIVDSAGRQQVDDGLMDELRQAKEALRPHYVILVVDSMTGQDAVNQARAFQEKIGVDGAILTKLDGDSRGGAALSIVSVAKVPILFAGMGERLEALEPFYPDRLASRILGMGDVMSLIEQAQGVVEQKEAEELQRRLRREEFTLDDFLKQIQMVRKMGPLGDLLGKIPGLGSAAQNVDEAKAERQFRMTEAMIRSMTAEERRSPELLNGSRRLRIAKGSGTTVEEINRFLNQFRETKKMMKKFQQKGKTGLMGKGGMPF